MYGDFIRESSRLFVNAFEHELDDPRTLHETGQVMNRIGASCFEPNKELRLFASISRAGELDPVYAFSQACRDELLGWGS